MSPCRLNWPKRVKWPGLDTAAPSLNQNRLPSPSMTGVWGQQAGRVNWQLLGVERTPYLQLLIRPCPLLWHSALPC